MSRKRKSRQKNGRPDRPTGQTKGRIAKQQPCENAQPLLVVPRDPVESALDALRQQRAENEARSDRWRASRADAFDGSEQTVDFLLALNGLPIARDAVCRLALAHETWLGSRSDTRTAEALGVSPRDLEVAASGCDDARRRAHQERQRAARLGLEIIAITSPSYPKDLLDLELPPPVLFSRSQCPRETLGAAGISMVGPRRPDPWALEAARTLAQRFATAGLLVVSGFARGVDAACHRGALASGDGKTVAVLGTGHGVAYPRGQEKLRDEIAERGAVLSEFPIGTPPLPRHFPIRNRIIAALGWATLVVQASERSGSLITAREALELGREVMALPGRPGDRRSVGSNRLLRDGARMVLSAREVLESTPTTVLRRLLEARTVAQAHLETGNQRARPTESESVSTALLELVEATPLTAEELSQVLELPFVEVQELLLRLELEGRLRRCAGARFLSTEPQL